MRRIALSLSSLGLASCGLFLSFAAGLGACSSSDAKTDGGTTPATTSTAKTDAATPVTPTPLKWRAVVGAGGVILQTFDDHTWEKRSAGAPDLFGVACSGNQLGWAAGSGGFIGHTTDGGRTWVAQKSGVASPLRAVRFGSPSFGVAVGDGGAVLVTHDGGASWAKVASGSSAALRGVAVAVTQGHGLALVVGDGGTLLRSEDDGATFQPVSVTSAGDLRGIAVDDDVHAAIAVDAAGGLFRSVDLGKTFQREATAPGPLQGVALAADGSSAIAVGDGGLVMERGAGPWSRVESGSTANLLTALVPDDDGATDYVAGEHGALLARVRGVSGWTAIPTGTDATLFSLEDL